MAQAQSDFNAVRDAIAAHDKAACESAEQIAHCLPLGDLGGDAGRFAELMRGMERQNRDLRVLRNRLRDADTAMRGQSAIRYGRTDKHWARTCLSDLRARMKAWPRLRETMAAAIAPVPQPLYPEPRPRQDRSMAMEAVWDAVTLGLHKFVNPADQDASAVEHGCYADIYLSPARFMEHMHAAYRYHLAQERPGPLRFLDVGCGGGMKVLFAAEFFARADGLEYDPGYAAAAQNLLAAQGGGDCACILGDAVTFDHYADYDVIYFYQPMADDDGLLKMETRILSHARPGTILVAPYIKFASRHAGEGCVRIAGATYVVGHSEAEMAVIRARAESIGVAVARRAPQVAPGLAVWTTLIEAIRARGFEPLEPQG